MGVEFVKLSPSERTYGQRALLQAQLELLNSSKNLRRYKKSRAEEFIIKISLKNKLEEINTNLAILDKMLPKVRMHDHIEHVKRQKEEIIAENKDYSIEQELENIKMKLAGLQ